MNIADVFFAAHLDDGQLLIDSNKSGLKAGQLLGQKMSSGISSNLKTAAFTAIAAGSAIAGRGLLELNSIEADFQAATGASASEAEAAGKAINAMGGRNLEPLKEIGSTLIEVETRLDQTGDAAFAMTERFLKFGVATKQGPTEAVKAFDDILDAWGLTADHSGEIMDKLVVSHQRYGGSIEEDQRALAQFAPQLKALNATVDDGIGLLNLFAVSGLDASVATRALNTAVTKLKPGQSLNDLVKQITAIEDPTKRAQKAVEIFGARGGVALANALKPGIAGLGDFEVSATDAAGATDKAAQVIEDSFGNRIQLAIKGAGAAIIGFGQTIGPLGSALTGLVSIAGALGPKLGSALAGAWKAAAASSLLGGAIGVAADKAATLYIRALLLGDAISGAISSAWSAVKGAGQAAAREAGILLGGIYGAAVGASSKIGETLSEGWAAASGKVVAAARAAGLLSAAAFAAPFAIPILATVVIATVLPTSGNYQQVKDAATAAGVAAFSKIDFSGYVGSLSDKLTGKLADDLVASAPTISKAVTLSIKGAFGSDLAARSDYARAYASWQANILGGALAKGILDKRNVVDQAWQDLLDMIKNGQSATARTAQLIGELASKNLVKGLHAGDPATRAQARYTKQVILDELAKLEPRVGTLSKDAMEALRKAMKSKDPQIRAAAVAIYKSIHTALPDKSDGKTWGSSIAEGLRQGLIAKQAQIRAAAHGLALIIANTLETGSPSKEGPFSRNGGPSSYGISLGRLVAEGLRSTIPTLRAAANAAAGTLGSAFAVPVTGPRVPTLANAIPSMAMTGSYTGAAGIAAPTSGVTNNFYNTANVTGLVKASDPLAIARTLGRFQRTGILERKGEPV